MTYPIRPMLSPNFTVGHPAPYIAIVHHRMVGILASTDAAFANPAYKVATNFGIGWCVKHGPRQICIHQYVRLGDQHWGNTAKDQNGNPIPSEWTKLYGANLANSRTVSIEHQDNANLAAGKGKGIVPEEVLLASLWLDRLLLDGSASAMAAAGISFRAGSELAAATELRAIPVDANHLIDHHFVAGALKPSCWRPWADDKVGFPQARYLTELSTPGVQPVEQFNAPIGSLLTVPANTVLYDNGGFASSPTNVTISGAPLPRDLRLIGLFPDQTRLVGYKPDGASVEHSYWVKTGVGTVKPATATDCSAAVSAAIAKTKASAKVVFG